MTDRDGNVVRHYEYSPFGNETYAADNAGYSAYDSPSNRYTGQIFDSETGLYYYNARFYDAELARFIQADTVLPTQTSQGLNRYTYCENNPLKYVDPSGHEPITLIGAIIWGAVAGAVIGGTMAACNGGDFRDILRGMALGAVTGAIGGAFGFVGYAMGGWIGAGVAGAAAGALNAAITGGDVAMGAIIGGISGLVSGAIRAAGENSAAKSLSVELRESNGTNQTPGGTGYEMKGKVIKITEKASSGAVVEKSVGKTIAFYDKNDNIAKSLLAEASDADYYKGVANLDEARSYLKEFSKVLAERGEYIKQIQILDHANAGYQTFGTTLFAENGGLYRQIGPNNAWEDLCSYVGKGGSVELRGCNVAKGSVGLKYIQKLADSGGCDVYAYDDLIYSKSSGFNWLGRLKFNHSGPHWGTPGDRWLASPGGAKPINTDVPKFDGIVGGGP